MECNCFEEESMCTGQMYRYSPKFCYILLFFPPSDLRTVIMCLAVTITVTQECIPLVVGFRTRYPRVRPILANYLLFPFVSEFRFRFSSRHFGSTLSDIARGE